MKVIMNINQLKKIQQVEDFLDGSQAVAFGILGNKDEAYAWIQKILEQFEYLQLNKSDKGVIIQYIMKVTNYSRQQITRLIKQYRQKGKIIRSQRTVAGFQAKYTALDALRLAKLDEVHGTLSGPATKKLCERAFNIFNQQEYERLAGISVSHLYNIRKSNGYKRQRYVYEKTKPKASNIGERRKPEPNGQPGYIRIDTVHQGDLDKQKGVYHINAVDEVTQFEIVGSVEKISENHLIPLLEYLLNAFPFQIKGFHSDNGSEYVNKDVVKLLNKLLIEFTKSRPRHSNDNGLAETKNGAVIRKIFGYSHIPQRWAGELNKFNQQYLNPYINFHRPSFFPTLRVDKKGKEKRIYKYEDMTTPYEKLKSLPNAASYLKPGITFKELDEEAYKMTDTESARQLNQARQKLFRQIFERKAAG